MFGCFFIIAYYRLWYKFDFEPCYNKTIKNREHKPLNENLKGGMEVRKFEKVQIEEMRDAASLFCEVEGFTKEAEAVWSMSDEEVVKFFFELFPNKA